MLNDCTCHSFLIWDHHATIILLSSLPTLLLLMSSWIQANSSLPFKSTVAVPSRKQCPRRLLRSNDSIVLPLHRALWEPYHHKGAPGSFSRTEEGPLINWRLWQSCLTQVFSPARAAQNLHCAVFHRVPRDALHLYSRCPHLFRSCMA